MWVERAQVVEYWLRYAIFLFATISVILLHFTPRTKNIFKIKVKEGGEEAGEKGREPSDKVETDDKADGQTTHDSNQKVK